MLRFAVCEEEMFARKKISYGLKQIFHQRGQDVEVVEFATGNALKSAILQKRFFDALFLNTELSGMDGIELGVWLRNHQWNNLLIYISDCEQRVFQSFQAHPFRFIRKSLFSQEMVPASRDMLEELRKRKGEFLMFRSGGQTFRIDPYDIIYAESQRKKQYIYTDQHKLEINDTFKEVLEFLKPYGFIQIHRSYVVNYRYVQSFCSNTMELCHQIQLPVGRQRLTEIREEFAQLSLA